MGFFNRVAGLFKARRAPPVLAANGDVVQFDRATQLRAKIAEYMKPRPGTFLSATHRTSHRTVAMDLRDAKKRRHIAKRKGS